jgi:hypothetical protein
MLACSFHLNPSIFVRIEHRFYTVIAPLWSPSVVALNHYLAYTTGMTRERSGALCFDNPATYRIAVLGELDAGWSASMEGMAISVAQQPEGMLVSTLEGTLTDQAALAGVLNALYELHCTVLSVQRLRGNAGSPR